MAYNPLSSDEIRNKIIATAAEMFVAEGIEKSEMKEIAQQAGIGRSTLYRYFPEKEQLSFAVLNNIVRDLLVQCYTLPERSLLEEKTGYEITEYSFQHMVEILMENAHILHFMAEFDCMFSNGYPEGPDTQLLWEGIDNNFRLSAKYIEKGQKDGSIATCLQPYEMALTIGHSVIGICQRLLPRSEVYKQESGYTGYAIAKKAVDMLLRSIRL